MITRRALAITPVAVEAGIARRIEGPSFPFATHVLPVSSLRLDEPTGSHI